MIGGEPARLHNPIFNIFILATDLSILDIINAKFSSYTPIPVSQQYRLIYYLNRAIRVFWPDQIIT